MKGKDFLDESGNGADQARLRILLEQYIAPDTAQMLVDGSKQFPEHGTIQDLTVVFADITNFTRLLQRVELHLLAQFLREFFALFTMAVYRDKGTLGKFMGDGALAIFGAPLVLDDPADRALSAGKTLLEQFQPLRRKFLPKAAAFQEISLGIGIGASEMFIGNLGSDERFDYTVIGVGVNAAQRLAALSAGDVVACTDAVLQRLTADVEIATTEKLLLKGFDEQISVHRLSPFLSV